jgi:hypothetical protein
MDGVAKIFAFILIFFFASGAYLALSPGIFTRMGAKKADNLVLELREDLKARDSKIAQLEAAYENESLRVRALQHDFENAEQLANEYKFEAAVASQSLTDSLEVLNDTRSELFASRADYAALDEDYQLAISQRNDYQARTAALEQRNAAYQNSLAEKEVLVAQLEFKAGQYDAARTEVKLYRNGAGLLILLLIMLGTLNYWRNHRTQEGTPARTDENPAPVSDHTAPLTESSMMRKEVLN